MARRRRIRWPTVVTMLVLAGVVGFLLARPSVLSPLVTRLVNRQLEASLGGELRVGGYQLRPFAGLDAHDVTLTVPGERGGLTLVAVDTLELDFRLREVLGLDVRFRRLAARGVEIYHVADEPLAEPARRFSPPRLQVDLAVIADARAELSDHHGQLRERIASLDWRGEMTSDGEEVRVFTRRGRVVWPTRSSVLERIYGGVTVTADGLRSDGLDAVWNDGEIEIAGAVGDTLVDITARGRNVNARRTSDLTGLPLEFSASGDIDIRVVVAPDTTRLDALFTGRFEAWDLERVRGQAWIANDQVVFHQLAGQVGGADFDGSLAVAAEETITVRGFGRDLDLRKGLIPEIDPADLPATTGHGRLEIVHTMTDEATRVRAWLRDGEVEIMPFDSCYVDVWARGDSLRFEDIDLRRGSVHARLAGSSDRHEVFAGTLAVVIDDLRDLPARWEWPPLTGGARGSVAVDGPLDALRVAGAVAYSDLTLGPMLADRGEASVRGSRVLGEDWQLTAAARGDGFHLGGVPLGTYALDLRGDAISAVVDSFHAARGDTQVAVRGRADFLPGRVDLAIAHGDLWLAGNRWRLVDPLAAAVGPGLLEVPRFHLLSGQGELLAAAHYDAADSVVAGRLDVSNFDLNLLDPFLQERFRPGGRATARAEVRGSPALPEVSVRGRVVGAAFDVARIDTLDLAGGLRDEVVTIDTLGLVTADGRVAAAGTIANPGASLDAFWPDAALDLDLAIQGGELAFLRQFELEAVAAMDGRYDGTFHAGGTTRDPLIRGDFVAHDFSFHWLTLDTLAGTLRADRTQLALAELAGNQDQLLLTGRLELPLRFDLLSVPESPADGPFLAQLEVAPDSDLGPLLHATAAFTRIEGRGGGELIISGPMNDPGYQGEIALRGVGFVLRGNQEIFHDCRAVGTFGDDHLLLTEIAGQEGLRGTFRGEGEVIFDGLELATWGIDFEADRFLVASIPDLRAVVRTRNGGFSGVPVGPDSTLVPRFTGDYEVIKGRYTGNFSDPGTGALDPTLGNVAPDWLADVRITGPPRSTRIVNATMELDLSGDVELVRDADGLVLNGAMTIDNGRLPVFHNTFRVVRGELDFSRAVGVVPSVDIDAETRVRVRSQVAGQSRVERITVHASGPASAMTISYSSESGYPRAAIERMLLGLSPYPDEQGDQNAFAAASIGAGFNILEREIAREIDLFDTIEIDQIQREQDTGVGLDPLIGVGKYLGTDLYIKYAQGLNQNDHDILIEYQINDLLLLQTEIRRRIDEYQGDATYSVDLKYRHEY